MKDSEIIIKLSYPSSWDKDWGKLSFPLQTPGRSGKWKNCTFFLNRKDIHECDYWIIYENIDDELFETTNCPPQNCIYVTGEERDMWGYNQDFLNQFGGVITSRDDISHKRKFESHYISPWWVNKDYDELVSIKAVKKSKWLSAIISNHTTLEYHKKRYAFINKLKGHFKEKLDWYGRGEYQIDDKWNGLAPYYYSIAIENSVFKNYFTEKLIDCILSYSLPFYYGCPNINCFLPDTVVKILPIDDFVKCIDIIEEYGTTSYYNKVFNDIVASRNLILNELQFFPAISKIIEGQINQSCSLTKEKVIIHNKSHYQKRNWTNKQRLYRLKELFKKQLAGYRLPSSYS